MNQFVKDPQASLDYVVDWAEYLGSDTLSISTFSADTGITISNQTKTNTTATTWVSGGATGQTYNIKNSITTTGGRIDERTFKIIVRDR